MTPALPSDGAAPAALERVALPADLAARVGPGALAARVVLIAGATGGLGAATARACAAAGASVVLLGRKVRALERLYDELADAPATPAIYPLDLEGATPHDYEQLAATLERECGRLDGVLHAAASFEALTPATQGDPQAWARALHVNLTAPWLLTQACLPLLARSDAGRVVFVLDEPARMRRAYWGAYGVAKVALEGLVAQLGDELSGTPLRVVGVLPGPMRTALRAKAYFGEHAEQVPVASVFAPACVYALGPEALPAGALVDARPLGVAPP
jgi:NAD(P)-dependent dehydrogenase (short-subunit alcohol dehydrogenase family)